MPMSSKKRRHQLFVVGVGGDLVAGTGCKTGFVTDCVVGVKLVGVGLKGLEAGGSAVAAAAERVFGTGASSSGGGVVK